MQARSLIGAAPAAGLDALEADRGGRGEGLQPRQMVQDAGHEGLLGRGAGAAALAEALKDVDALLQAAEASLKLLWLMALLKSGKSQSHILLGGSAPAQSRLKHVHRSRLEQGKQKCFGSGHMPSGC